MANSVNPEQQAIKEQADLVQHFLVMSICPNIQGN